MIYFDALEETLDKRVKKVCAPLFGSGQFLDTGHDQFITNATVTFVKFRGDIYAVTCHHVLSAFASLAHKTKRRVVPSIHTGSAIHQFHFHRPNGRYAWTFMSCRDFPTDLIIDDQNALADLERKNADRPDIALAKITTVWPALRDLRNADAIDLDAWTEPDWNSVQSVWLAYGYPDGHKYVTGDKLSAPMPRVKAELASSTPSHDRPTYLLCSSLETDHGWGFSGLSGGPVLVAHASEDRFAFVGITFEGAPSAKEIDGNQESFISGKDIILRGYHLTPEVFQNWLSAAKFGVELN